MSYEFSESLSSAPRNPYVLGVINDRYILTGDLWDPARPTGNAPRNTCSILDTHTGEVEFFDGVGEIANGCVADGRFWWCNGTNAGRRLRSMTPDGVMTELEPPGTLRYGPVVTVDDEIWVFVDQSFQRYVQIYDIETNSFVSDIDLDPIPNPWTIGACRWGDSVWMWVSNWAGGNMPSSIIEIDIDTKTKVSTTAIPNGGPLASFDSQPHHNKWWSGGKGRIGWFDFATKTYGTIDESSVTQILYEQWGCYTFATYGDKVLAATESHLLEIDPVTDTLITHPFDTARQGRASVAVANGQIWSPSGAPFVR